MTDKRQPGSQVKVQLLAPNWLGDAVMFSALIGFLHAHRTLTGGRTLQLNLALREAWAPLFENDPRLHNLFMVQRNERHAGVLGGLKLGCDFRDQNPDAILLGPPSFRAGMAAWRSGAPIRIGFKGDGRSPLLTHAVAASVRGTFHHSAELVGLGGILLKALGDHDHQAEQPQAHPSLPGCQAILPAVAQSATPIWVLAPGATYGSAKSWPLNRALEFVREVINQRAVRVVLLGDSGASDFAAGLAGGLDLALNQDLEGGPGLVDLTGRTDLKRVVAILKSCQVFVGNDSGLMHLAAALGVPTVGIFGSSNPDWTSPQGPHTQVVNAHGFECRPCYLKNCNQKEFCLETVAATSVLRAIDALPLNNG